MKKISVISVICGCLIFVGCESAEPVKVAAPAINTPDGMISYLKGQNLPALKAVEP
jgi:hypothetical protein